MTGGEALVQSLIAHGVDTVFGIPGVQTYGLFDALQRERGRIRLVYPRHEQATGYMAYGYARTTGRPGVFTVVPGPGVLNTGAALCTAYGASAPILCLTGQVPSGFLGLGKGHLHELPDQLATLRGLTKWAARINHPAEAPATLAEAFHQMRSGRPRPAAVEMPWDVFTASAPVAAVEPLPQSVIEPDPQAIDAAVAHLAAAREPMIMVGSGAQHAAPEVGALAEWLQAPVVSLRGGRGIVGDDQPLGFNCVAGFERWPRTDVLVGIGTRLELVWFRWHALRRDLPVILLEIDPTQIPKLRPAVAIVGDAQRSTAALLEAVRRTVPARASRSEEFTALKARVRARVETLQPHVGYLDAMRAVLPRDGFFVDEICQSGFASLFAFPVYEPRTFVSSGHQGTLGSGYSTALGVKIAHPRRQVLSISGDGGFMFGVQELATAVQHRINVVGVVFNNGSFGNVQRDQEQGFDGRVIGSELANPDFPRLAESFGMTGLRARSPEELRRALEKAFAADAPALIEVPVELGAEGSPWPFLMPTRS
ncbi:MAG: hypothetical protein KGL34_09960 [Gammaproteobacteria bacterium]|nr:hypothetical protein [Gammaproteobacteria bacterium]